jgi:hypothetical protein
MYFGVDLLDRLRFEQTDEELEDAEFVETAFGCT